MRKRKPGRPRNAVRHGVLSVRLPLPLLHRFRRAAKEARRTREITVGEFLAEIFEQSLPEEKKP